MLKLSCAPSSSRITSIQQAGQVVLMPSPEGVCLKTEHLWTSLPSLLPRKSYKRAKDPFWQANVLIFLSGNIQLRTRSIEAEEELMLSTSFGEIRTWWGELRMGRQHIKWWGPMRSHYASYQSQDATLDGNHSKCRWSDRNSNKKE